MPDIKKKNFIQRTVCKYHSVMTARSSEKLIFGSWWGMKFADNPKYLYLYALSKGLDAIWITKSEMIYSEMKKENLPVAMADSGEGISICKEAKYVFYCTSISDVNENYVGGAVLINLWHGIPLKKIVYDDTINNTHLSIKTKLYDIVNYIPYKKKYVVSTSERISEIYKSAFRLPSDHILQLGQPRNDAFFNGYLKKLNIFNSYNKVILYMPTHRNEGKTCMNTEMHFEFDVLDKFCKDHNFLFVIKKHFYHKNEKIDLKDYNNIVDYTGMSIDTQELLFNADVLITDYSSCYIDYLLLDRPIIFYCYDYEEYLANDRQLYFDYEKTTPGAKCRTFDDLMKAISIIFDDIYECPEIYQEIKNLFYSKENQKCVSQLLLNTVLELH